MIFKDEFKLEDVSPTKAREYREAMLGPSPTDAFVSNG